jgi:hypothetical protein
MTNPAIARSLGMAMRKASLAILVLTSACASMTPEEARVRVTKDPDAVRGCKLLGNVSSAGVFLGGRDDKDLFRKEVAAIGGNVGYVTSMSGSTRGASTISYKGEAYLCEQPKP